MKISELIALILKKLIYYFLIRFSDCKLVPDKNLKAIATNDEAAQKLWELSKSFCGLNSTPL
jgi:hypothetical protein